MTITKLWFSDEKIFIQTEDGQNLWQSLLYYQRLKNATEKQRLNYELGIFGIHWEDVDEDISYESFTYDNPEPTGISKIFLSHPELNASAIAHRLGMKQSLLAQYINGTKTPSEERKQTILNAIHEIGKELCIASL